jgi:hypothetical protein
MERMLVHMNVVRGLKSVCGSSGACTPTQENSIMPFGYLWFQWFIVGVSFQVTFDCSDPAGLAEFWAEVLHYKEQDPPEGFATWQEFLRAQSIPENEWNSASAIVDPEGKGSRVYFQKVSERKTVKNRVHLDINVSGGRAVSEEERIKRILAEAERLIGLKATKQNVVQEQAEFWIVMCDPEGNEFCLQ